MGKVLLGKNLPQFTLKEATGDCWGHDSVDQCTEGQGKKCFSDFCSRKIDMSAGFVVNS
jgi:hypothetical protein